jgi:hypothetical protein
MRMIGCDLHAAHQTIAMLDCESGEVVEWVRLRTRVMNALQGLALGQGVRRGTGSWSRAGQATITALALPPHAFLGDPVAVS